MAVHKNFKSAFNALQRRIGKAQKELPAVIGNEGTRFWIENFDKQGFQDKTLEAWAIPKRKIPGTPEYKYPKKKDLGRRTRKTLIKTGKLRRAVNQSLKERTAKRIVWRVSGLPYAKRHNEGLAGMPKREYMGSSEALNRRFKNKIIDVYKKNFK